MNLKEKAKEDLREKFYTFTLYNQEEQRRLTLAWELGYVRGQESMLNELGETKG